MVITLNYLSAALIMAQSLHNVTTTTEVSPPFPPSTPSSEWSESDLQRLNAWLYCVSVVDFDLTEGQLTSLCYLLDILSEDKKSNIANLAFPDTHSCPGEVVNAKFVFRVRARMLSPSAARRLSGSTAISYSHRLRSHP